MITYTVDDRQMGHVNQVGHLSKTTLSLLEIHVIGSVDTSESKQENYDQIWHLWPPYQKLLRLSHFSWLSHSPVGHCTIMVNIYFSKSHKWTFIVVSAQNDNENNCLQTDYM